MKENDYTLPSYLIADLPEIYQLKPKKEIIIETEERTYVSTENLLGHPRVFTLPSHINIKESESENDS